MTRDPTRWTRYEAARRRPRISITLSPELRALVQPIADARQGGLSHLIEEALRDWLARQPEPR